MHNADKTNFSVSSLKDVLSGLALYWPVLMPDQITSNHSHVTFAVSSNFYFLPVSKQV